MMLIDTNWDDESRDRQNRLFLEILVCVTIVFLAWLLFG